MKGIFLDTETNGLNFKRHFVIEIAYRILDLSSGEVLSTYEAIVKLSKEEWAVSDPESLKVNGFTEEKLRQGLERDLITEQIIQDFTSHHIQRGQAVFICQNPSFDRYFFSQLIDPDTQEARKWPYHWFDLASMHWARAILQKESPSKIGFTKDKIAKVYNLPPENYPHRALNGVDHLINCYRSVVGFPTNNN